MDRKLFGGLRSRVRPKNVEITRFSEEKDAITNKIKRNLEETIHGN